MKKWTFILLLLVDGIITASGQCTANYSHSGTTDTLTFTNLSTIPNVHFYWNFGDGSGSNDFSPTHVFPDDGKYLVTLYAVDTVINCVDYYENWIDVIKPDTIDCIVLFTDTIIGTTPQTTNLSDNCSGLNLGCHVFGPAQNICNGFTIEGWFSSLFLHGMQATSHDSIYGYRILNAYYKTFPYNYSSSKNYQNCSANFEVVIDYQPTFAVATFTAMNKYATNYTFYITGFGSPIPLSGQSVSYNFDYISYRRFSPKNIYLIIEDAINNCADSVNQTILIKNPNYTFPVNCAIYTPIENQSAGIGTNVQFYISASSDANYQWQQDAGLGFVDLTNAGPYNGVTTNTLTISNVQGAMNNYQYRCILYDSSLSGCHNTSSPASLSVLFDINDIKLYPNPASNHINIDLPPNINNVTVTIFTILGQQQIRTTTSEPKTNIDVYGLTNGVYIVEFSAENRVARKIFIKQ